MDFGIVLQTDPPSSEVVRLMKAGEDAGFRYGWTFDSAVLWQEPFVIYSQILAATVVDDRRADGDQPRHPRLVGDGLDLRHAERDVRQPDGSAGSGRGDSAHRVVGKAARRTWPPCATAMHVVKELAEGRESHHERQGRADPVESATAGSRCGWAGVRAEGAEDGRRAPPTASSCRTADPADRALDDRLGGATRPGAAGRDPGGITICVAAPAYIGDDLPHQREQLRWFGGGWWATTSRDLVRRYGESGPVPPELTDYIRRGGEGYDYSHHGEGRGNPLDRVRAGRDRRPVSACWARRPRTSPGLQGAGRNSAVDQFSLYLMHDEREADAGELRHPDHPEAHRVAPSPLKATLRDLVSLNVAFMYLEARPV